MDAKLFLTAFTTLFLAEFGDKTQLAVITMSASSKNPWSVFFGSVAALALVTAIGVLLGQGGARFLPEALLKKIAASLFIGIGVWMLVRP